MTINKNNLNKSLLSNDRDIHYIDYEFKDKFGIIL